MKAEKKKEEDKAKAEETKAKADEKKEEAKVKAEEKKEETKPKTEEKKAAKTEAKSDLDVEAVADKIVSEITTGLHDHTCDSKLAKKLE